MDRINFLEIFVIALFLAIYVELTIKIYLKMIFNIINSFENILKGIKFRKDIFKLKEHLENDATDKQVITAIRILDLISVGKILGYTTVIIISFQIVKQIILFLETMI